MTRPSVLVVEDDKELRAMYASALEAAGCSVCVVEDGVDALRQVAERPPDVIVLDLMLPTHAGHDVQRELASHAETRDIPIVVVTGTDIRHLSPTDFDCVLQKPVDVDVLIDSVDRCLHDVRGRGRRFSVGAGAGGRASPASHPIANSRARPQRRHVLVVDDDVPMQGLLRLFLEERMYQVTTAGGVGEAIGVLEQECIDAVLLDVRMPHRSGLELLEFIRLDRGLCDTPVLILTGAELTSQERAVIEHDHGDLFFKSDDLEGVARRLDELVG